jgi:hypothetical protein
VEACYPLRQIRWRVEGDDLTMAWDEILLPVLTPSVLLGVTIWMFFKGAIVQGVFYREKVAESEKWRLAYEAERAIRITSDAQTRELFEQGKTTHAIVVAMFDLLEQNKPSGGTQHVVPLVK